MNFSPTLTVFIGTAALGLIAGMLGTFVVLRKRALIGDTLAHATLPGVALAFLLTGEREFLPLLLGAWISSLVAALLMMLVKKSTPLKDDSLLALTLGCFFAFGIFLLDIAQRTTSGNKSGIKSFIFGHAAGMLPSDVVTIFLVSLFTLLVLLFFFKEITALSFDAPYLASQGFPSLFVDAVLMFLITIVTTSGLPAVGAILITALLFIPALSARLLSRSVTTMIFLSGIFGVLSAVSGTALSLYYSIPFSDGTSIPTGPAIVVVAAGIFSLCAMKPFFSKKLTDICF